MIWDIFLGGSSPTRPFGTAVLDGYVSAKRLCHLGDRRIAICSRVAITFDFAYRIDMDIEGGAQTGYVAFLTALRSLMNGGNKKCVYFRRMGGSDSDIFHSFYITAGRVFLCGGGRMD